MQMGGDIVNEGMFGFIEQDVRVGLIILFACCIFTVLASFIDMWTKLEALRAIHEKPQSRPLMKTGIKVMEYLRLIFFVLMVDILGLLCFSFYSIPFCTVLMTLGILFREGLSMRENYKLKKSNTIDAVDYALKIVECARKEDADKIIAKIKEINNLKEKV